MRFTMISIVFLMLCGIAFAGTAKGTFILDGKSHEISSALARTDENPFEKERRDVLLLLTDQPVIESDFDLGKLESMAESGKLHGLLLRIDDQKEVTGLIVIGVVQRSGNSVCEFEANTFKQDQISGKVFLAEPDESFGRKYTFDIEFSSEIKDAIVPMVDEKSGTPLPADGGDPGRSYREYEKAIQSGNLQALKKYLVPQQASKLDAPDAPNMLEFMKMMRAQNVKILKGFTNGDRATLVLEGKDPMSGGKTGGSVRLVKNNNQWVIEKESWSASFE